MASEILKVDENNKPVIGLVTDDANLDIKMGRIDNATKGLKVMIVGGVGGGTVTSISQGTGIAATPNPIIGTGTIGLSTPLAPMATLTGNSLKTLRVNAGETAVEYFTGGAGTITSITASSGITLNPNPIIATGTIANNLITGLASGQTVIGGVGATENLLLSSTAHATKGYIGIINPPVATANFGSLSIGSGKFDGITAGKFVGNVAGTSLAINEVTGYTGNLADWQVNGSSVFSVTYQGAVSASGSIAATQSIFINGSNAYLQINQIGVARAYWQWLESPKIIDFYSAGSFRYSGVAFTNTSGTNNYLSIVSTYNQTSGTAANTDLLISRVETALGSGAQLFIDLQNGVAGTTSVFQVDRAGNIPLMASLGTTGARVVKGWFTDLEITNAPTLSGVVIPSISSTSTLTNKRINPRLVTAASYTTNTGTSLDVSTCDQFEITAQADALLFNNPLGTPLGGQKLIIRIKDNAIARALTYGTQFRAMGNALPTTTVLSKTLYMGFIYNATDIKWDLVAVAQEV